MTSATERRIGYGAARRAGRLVAAMLAVALLTAFSGTASGATGVAWDLTTVADTAAVAGGQVSYNLYVTNIGDAPTDGSQVTLTATLPSDLTLAIPLAFDPNWSCAAFVPGSSSVTCTSTSVIPALVGPLLVPSLSIVANVDPLATGIRSTVFEVAGGGPSNPSVRTTDPTLITSDALAFGVDGFDGQVTSPSGDAFTQAGGHPADVTTQIDFNRGPNPRFGSLWPAAPPKDVIVELPPGLVGNPTATAGLKCTAEQLVGIGGFQERPTCPPGSQVGTALVIGSFGLGGFGAALGPVSVFNMEPPPNVPARFGFNVAGSIVTLNARLRSGGDYGISAEVSNIPEALAMLGTRLTLWGVPADPSHEPLRSCPGELQPYRAGPSCKTDAPRLPFWRLPTSCEPSPGSPVQDGLMTTLHTDSWFEPGRSLADGSPDLSDPSWKSASFTSHLPPGFPANPDDPSTPWGANTLPTGCDRVPFDPTLAGGPNGPAVAGAPAGWAFDLQMPQSDNPDAIGHADLRKAVVTLPPEVHVSPSSAHGLGACTQAQVGLRSTADADCPGNSKIGTLEIETPLLEEPLTGAIYLAKPHENPFGTLLSIYLVAKGPGVIVKLAGRIDPDPVTGQLTTTFDEQPQLPFSRLRLEFKDGPRSPLVNPVGCGTYETRSTMTGWNGKVAEVMSSFTVSQDGHGAPCPAREFTPGFHAGTENPIAGAKTPFGLQMTRDDIDHQLAGVTVDMPQGLLGRIADAVLCSSGQAAAGTCGGGSRIGKVTVGAGAGPNPFYITNGRVHITEGYKGAPFGLSIVVPAVAGPFDLGDVVVRSAIFVDRHDATLRIVSDPLPTILEGIPLDVRDVRVEVDRDGFIVNPTSCEEQQVGGAISSTAGDSKPVSTRFQVAGCAALDLSPRMAIRVGGRRRTQRGRSTSLRTKLRMPEGGSNLRQVRVTLPTVLNARLTVINDACTREQYDSGSDECEFARTGTAAAVTPLLRDPLRGGVYFVRNGNPLPDLFVRLRGQVDFDLVGRITIPGSKRLRTTFDLVPDVPVSMFALRLEAGRDGSVGNAANLCSRRGRRSRVALAFVGQNGERVVERKRLRVKGCSTRSARAKRGRRGTRRGR